MSEHTPVSEQRIQGAPEFAKATAVGCPVAHMRSGMTLAGTPAGDAGGMACDDCVQAATRTRDAALLEAACAAVCSCCAPEGCEEELHHDGREWRHGGHVCRASLIRTALAYLLEAPK